MASELRGQQGQREASAKSGEGIGRAARGGRTRAGEATHHTKRPCERGHNIARQPARARVVEKNIFLPSGGGGGRCRVGGVERREEGRRVRVGRRSDGAIRAEPTKDVGEKGV